MKRGKTLNSFLASICSTSELSIHLTKILSAVKEGQQKYCETVYSRSGINHMWILKNSKDLSHMSIKINVETVSLQRRQICYRWGTPAYWSLVPRSSMLYLNLKFRSFSQVSSIKTFDFSTLFTTLSHDKLKTRLQETIYKAFNHRNYGSNLQCPSKGDKYVIDEELQHTDHLFLGVACFSFWILFEKYVEL
jgi:hypothetical protein